MNAVIYRLDFDCGDGRVYSYWGSSVDFKKRMHQHRSDLRKGKHCNKWMQRSFAKYGDFRESVVMLCSRESLAENERCMIARHYAQDYCLNLTMETVSVMRDPEVKARAAEALRAVQQTEEWKRNVKAAAARRTQDPEWQEKHKARLQKMHADPAWRAANKAAMQKLAQDPEFRKRRAAANRAVRNKAVELTMPDGTVRVFESGTVAAGEIGVPRNTLTRWLLGKSPWPGQGKYVLKQREYLRGLTGRYIE